MSILERRNSSERKNSVYFMNLCQRPVKADRITYVKLCKKQTVLRYLKFYRLQGLKQAIPKTNVAIKLADVKLIILLINVLIINVSGFNL